MNTPSGPLARLLAREAAQACARAARSWLLAPLTDRIQEVSTRMALDLEQLQQAATRTGGYVAQIATIVPDLRGKIALLTEQLANAGGLDDATRAQLAAITASVDASADALASVVAEPVNDPAVPTGPVEAPPVTNPDTPDPGSVDGSVPALEPLPPEVDPGGTTSDTSPGTGAADQAGTDAEASAPDVVGGDGAHADNTLPGAGTADQVSPEFQDGVGR